MRMIDAAEASGELQAGRHDRRADVGQHRRRAGHRRPAARLPLHLRLPGQGQRRQDRHAAGLRRRGGGLPDRGRARGPALLLLGVRPAGPRDARRLEARPVRQRRTTRARTTRPPARRSGSRPRAGSPTSSPASAPAARSAAPAATSRSSPAARCRSSAPTPRARSTPAAPGGPYLVEGVGEDFWPTTYDRDDLRRDHRGVRRRLVRDDPAPGPRGGAARRRLVRHGRGRRAARSRRRLGPDDVVVVLLPDGGRGYLSKIFNDNWMADYGFLERLGRDDRRRRAAGEVGRHAVAGARPPERDGPRGDRHPARVRRLADAGRAGPSRR